MSALDYYMHVLVCQLDAPCMQAVLGQPLMSHKTLNTCLARALQPNSSGPKVGREERHRPYQPVLGCAVVVRQEKVLLVPIHYFGRELVGVWNCTASAVGTREMAL